MIRVLPGEWVASGHEERLVGWTGDEPLNRPGIGNDIAARPVEASPF